MIITREHVKSDWLEIEANSTTHDAAIDRFIQQAEKIIDGYCRQPITEEYGKTIYFNGHCGIWHNSHYTVPITLTSLSYRELPTDSWTATSGAVVHDGKIYYESGYEYPEWKLVINAGYRGGIVSTVSIAAAGSGYSAASAATTTPATNADATGCTLTTTVSTGALATATVSAGGREYRTNDVLAVAGGTSGTVSVTGITSNVPYDIQQAAAILVVAAFKKSNKNRLGGSIGVGTTSTSEGGVTSTITIKDVSAEVQQLLSPYRVYWF